HQDGEYWPIRPLATCSVWLALDDVTKENGCMRFIPGSHKSQTPFAHARQNRDDVVINMEIDTSAYSEADAVDIELEAGQMSLHDIYLIHGSNANRSNKRRAGLALRYMPASSHFDREMFPPSEKTGLRIDFGQRPLLLLRGEDVSGQNDLETGRQWLTA
ncbi:MAG: phytanoyl-CoA dioxygenase family protein, partial [Rhizobiales bacterium]|nr:phytanoyl-CoA dioxygenase family protein [Hyphomicrobiales bacterium]